MRSVVALVTAATITLATVDAVAEPTVVSEAETARWYGWQTLLVSGGAVGLGFVLADRVPYGIVFAAAAYALGAPTVHWARGNVRAGVLSAAIHLGVPLALAGSGYALGCAVSTCRGRDEPFSTGAIVGVGGALVGLLLAPAIDAAFIAYDEPDLTETVMVAPGWDPATERASIDIAVRF